MSAIYHIPEHLLAVTQVAASLPQARSWLAGGAVRDLLLGRPMLDLDVVTEGDAIGLARMLADQLGGSFVLLDEQHQVARAIVPVAGETLVVDWAGMRDATIEGDLLCRDLTINAIALPLEAIGPDGSFAETALVDIGGVADLREGMLRPCYWDALHDDPLRGLRALRIASALRMQIGPELHALLLRDGRMIANVSPERVRDELMKLLATRHSAAYLRYLDQLGILSVIFPEWEQTRGVSQLYVHAFDVLEHLLQTVASAEWMLAQLGIADTPPPPAPPALDDGPYPPSFFLRPDALTNAPDISLDDLPYREELRAHFESPVSSGHSRAALWKLAILLHDIAKPATRVEHVGKLTFHEHQTIGADMAQQMLRRLRFSSAEVAYVGLVIREHMRPGQLGSLEELTRRAIYRFFRDTGDAGADVLLHSHADHLAAKGSMVRDEHWAAQVEWTAWMLRTQRESEEIVRPQRVVDGRDLMTALGIGPGKLVGYLLNEITESQAAGEVTTAEEALDLARRLLDAGAAAS